RLSYWFIAIESHRRRPILDIWDEMQNSGRKLCAGPISRRSLLQAGALGLSSLGLGDLLRLRANAAPESDTSIIFIWLPGGPPHMEMYDMKPEAPADYRGEFRPIPSVVPGLDVCEHLPLHARMADKFNIVRSVAHEFADHG